jgi:hypothetical protein
MVSLLDNFAKVHNEMDEFYRKLAIIILKHGVDKDILSKPDKLIEKCSNWLKYVK